MSLVEKYLGESKELKTLKNIIHVISPKSMDYAKAGTEWYGNTYEKAVKIQKEVKKTGALSRDHAKWIKKTWKELSGK